MLRQAINRLREHWNPLDRSRKQNIVSIRKDILALAPIIVVSVILRFWDLGSVGFNSDEAVYSGQAATLAGHVEYARFFSIYRAHPLLFQFIVSLIYKLGASYESSRMVSATLGVMTVIVVFYLGKVLSNRNVGIFASILLGAMPYHVIITRQALVDVPMSFFFALTMLFLIQYQRNDRRIWLFATGASAGLTFLSKEVGILSLIVILCLLLFSRKLDVKNILIVSSAFLLAISPYLILLALRKEASQLASLYVQWQMSRPPNHTASFYLDILPGSMGYGIFAFSLLGILYTLKRIKLQYIVLLLWFLIPYIFFQFWPVKGFQYLISLVPALCLLVAMMLDSTWLKKTKYSKILTLGLMSFLLLSNNVIFKGFQPPEGVLDDSSILAGSGGLPHAREAALWIKDNTPEGSVFMTIGPSMANIIKFYGNREALGLSVSPDPMKHNPAYTPIINPDLKIRNGEIHYLVYDMYSKSQYFRNKLMGYVEKYGAIPVYTSYSNSDGVLKPAIVVYEVLIGGWK